MQVCEPRELVQVFSLLALAETITPTLLHRTIYAQVTKLSGESAESKGVIQLLFSDHLAD